MDPNTVLERAVRNNALWCDAVTGLHGKDASFTDSYWLSAGHNVPFYPNLITLVPYPVTKEFQSVVRRLVGGDREDSDSAGTEHSGVGIKDSFATLDLSGFGLRVLFESSWIYSLRSKVDPPIRTGADNPIDWTPVVDVGGLESWAAAWAAAGAVDQAVAFDLFRPGIISNPDVKVILGIGASGVAGGAVLSGGAGVVGISNLFSTNANQAAEAVTWRGVCEAARDVFGDVDLVGYESGASLLAAKRAGFSELGQLRIWVR